jgi:carbon storage regulator CsrA
MSVRSFNPENGGSTMLVLSRKSRESVVVGRADGSERMLTVTVLDISGGRVRLGFESDLDVPVHRSEVWERMYVSGQPDDSTRGPPAPIA